MRIQLSASILCVLLLVFFSQAQGQIDWTGQTIPLGHVAFFTPSANFSSALIRVQPSAINPTVPTELSKYTVCVGFTNILAQINLYASLDGPASTTAFPASTSLQLDDFATPTQTNYTWTGLDGAGVADATTCLYLPAISPAQMSANATLVVLVQWDSLMLPDNAMFYVNPEPVVEIPLQSSGWAVNGKVRAYQKAWFAAIPQTVAPPAQLRVEQCDFLSKVESEDGQTSNRFRVGLSVFPPSWGPTTYTRVDRKCADSLDAAASHTEPVDLGNMHLQAYATQVCPSTTINFDAIGAAPKATLFYVTLRPEKSVLSPVLPVNDSTWFSLSLRTAHLVTSTHLTASRVIRDMVLAFPPVAGIPKVESYKLYYTPTNASDDPSQVAMYNSACYLQRWAKPSIYTNTTVFNQTTNPERPSFSSTLLRVFDFYAYVKASQYTTDETRYGFVNVLVEDPTFGDLALTATAVPKDQIQGSYPFLSFITLKFWYAFVLETFWMDFMNRFTAQEFSLPPSSLPSFSGTSLTASVGIELFSQAAIVVTVSLGALLIIAVATLASLIIPPIIAERRAKKNYVEIDDPSTN